MTASTHNDLVSRRYRDKAACCRSCCPMCPFAVAIHAVQVRCSEDEDIVMDLVLLENDVVVGEEVS